VQGRGGQRKRGRTGERYPLVRGRRERASMGVLGRHWENWKEDLDTCNDKDVSVNDVVNGRV